MYADDMIIFSESVEGLQSEINTLSNCTRSWGLKVNIKKNKGCCIQKEFKIV